MGQRGAGAPSAELGYHEVVEGEDGAARLRGVDVKQARTDVTPGHAGQDPPARGQHEHLRRGGR
eukprot:878518-Prorocentrum_minimum.AAC.1